MSESANSLSDQALVDTWREHICRLAEEIGPRGPTLEGERQAAHYCMEQFRRLGLSARLENFRSATSIFAPHLYAALAMLAAFAIYPLYGKITAAIAAMLALLALACELMELGFVDNPLRWLAPKGQSQNAVACIEPAGEHKQDLILIGHIDTQRTPFIFKSYDWVKAYIIFTCIAFVAFLAQVFLYFLGIIYQWPWIWPATIFAAVCAALLAAMCIHADVTPFTRGANDNATAAGLVLALAEHLRTEPLRHTRVWLACTGCEEVQHYGAIDFFRRHVGEFHRPHALVFEMLGCDGPAWMTAEGIIVPFNAHPQMIALAEKIAAENPDLQAYPVKAPGGNTEMADAMRSGVPAICLTGMTRLGFAPYWHTLADTFDKIKTSALERNYAFAWRYIRRLDDQAQ